MEQNIDTLTTWTNPENNRHNVRVLADLCGLSHEQKEEMCATIEAESDFNLHAINYNYAFNKTTGAKYLASTDHGICQWNDYWHGKEISPTDAENDPEKAVRLMCAYWLRGQMNQWCAWNNGSYLKFMP